MIIRTPNRMNRDHKCKRHLISHSELNSKKHKADWDQKIKIKELRYKNLIINHNNINKLQKYKLNLQQKSKYHSFTYRVSIMFFLKRFNN